MLADLYLRISEDRAGDELGVTRQEEDGRRFFALRGWTLRRLWVDNDTSASKAGVVRRDWEAMMRDVEGRLNRVTGMLYPVGGPGDTCASPRSTPYGAAESR